MILRAEKLNIGYRHRRGEECALLEQISISVGEGEVVALLGSNGSGKSTLLRSICGLQDILFGTVYIQDKNTQGFSAEQWACHVSFVLTGSSDTGQLDVYSLVALGRLPYTGDFGSLTKEDHEKVEAALQQTSLLSYAWRKVNELSDGERQRVMIARALAQDTPLVLMDEPTAFLDLSGRKKMAELLKENAASTRRAFIISTHEIELALQFAHKFWIIGPNRTFHVCEDAASARIILERDFSL